MNEVKKLRAGIRCSSNALIFIIFIIAFPCHELGGGAQCVVYSPRNQSIISGGKRGDICIFDLRQRRRLGFAQAHDSSLKALAFDPYEQFYVTGSSEGNIKVCVVE